jgi:hypothetical protein
MSDPQVALVHDADATPMTMWPLYYYLQWQMPSLSTAIVKYDVADIVSDEDLVGRLLAGLDATGLCKTQPLVLVGAGVGGAAAMRLHASSACDWLLVDVVTISAPLRSASLASMSRRFMPGLLGQRAHTYLYAALPGRRCPVPPHRYYTLTLGLLANYFSVRMWRRESFLEPEHALHLRTPDHMGSLVNPALLKAVLLRVQETFALLLREQWAGTNTHRRLRDRPPEEVD